MCESDSGKPCLRQWALKIYYREMVERDTREECL